MDEYLNTTLKLIKSDDANGFYELYRQNLSNPLDFEQIAFHISEPKNGCENYIYGWMYHKGYFLEKNDRMAKYYYKLASKHGNGIAQNNLGYLYAEKEKYGKALYYFQLAIDQGMSYSYGNIARIYMYGLGVEKDYEKALHYFQLLIEFDYKKFGKDIFSPIEVDKNFIIAIYEKKRELEKENERLKDEIKKLKNELDCIPDRGKIYFDAKKHFDNNK